MRRTRWRFSWPGITASSPEGSPAGYRVTPELVERVRSGAWNPEEVVEDRDGRDAMAARGYWLAFQRVKDATDEILRDPASAAAVAREQHRGWYRELFRPAVTAGILEPAQLAGSGTNPVYIQNSRHVPPRPESVREAASRGSS